MACTYSVAEKFQCDVCRERDWNYTHKGGEKGPLVDDRLLYDTCECDIVYHGAGCYFAVGLRHNHSKGRE